MTEHAAEEMDWLNDEMIHYVSDEYMEVFRNTKKPKFISFVCPYTAETYFIFLSHQGFFR